MSPPTLKPVFRTKRAYERADGSDGQRFLVDRLWPRGIKKEALQLDDWIKEVAPSTELRKRFSHDPRQWPNFRRAYFRELEAEPAAVQRLLDAARHGPVTLVYSSREVEHNNAVALREFLESRATRRPRGHKAA
jgi:uncharacterized protein YeaO (DUF488 family)